MQKILPALVQYGPGGKPTGGYYQELPVLLLAQIQRQQRELNQLAAEVAQLQREPHR